MNPIIAAGLAAAAALFFNQEKESPAKDPDKKKAEPITADLPLIQELQQKNKILEDANDRLAASYQEVTEENEVLKKELEKTKNETQSKSTEKGQGEDPGTGSPGTGEDPGATEAERETQPGSKESGCDKKKERSKGKVGDNATGSNN